VALALLLAGCGGDGGQSAARCGVVQTGEACDRGAASPDCDVDCTRVECGDGTLNAAAGEACDDAGDSPACGRLLLLG
jgi:hypothetical protein